jgi:hypothetical protein
VLVPYVELLKKLFYSTDEQYFLSLMDEHRSLMTPVLIKALDELIMQFPGYDQKGFTPIRHQILVNVTDQIVAGYINTKSTQFASEYIDANFDYLTSQVAFESFKYFLQQQHGNQVSIKHIRDYLGYLTRSIFLEMMHETNPTRANTIALKSEAFINQHDAPTLLLEMRRLPKMETIVTRFYKALYPNN